MKHGKTLLLLLVLAAALSIPALAAEGRTYRVDENGETRLFTEADSEAPPEARLQEAQDETLPALAAPSELVWGKDYNFLDNVNDYVEIPGTVSWNINSPRQTEFELVIYRVAEGGDGDTPVYETTTWYLPDSFSRNSDEGFLRDQDVTWDAEEPRETTLRESGDYYFTVQALGDGTEYRDSEIARSEVWHYDAPTEQLPAPTVLRWDGNILHWNPVTDERVLSYETAYFFAKSAEEKPRIVGSSFSSGNINYMNNEWNFRTEVGDWILEHNGKGYYTVAVRAVSRDMTIVQGSDWAISEPTYIDYLGDKLQEAVNSLSETSTDEDKAAAVEAVRQLDTAKLGQTLAADRDNTGTTAQLEKLEELTGRTASVNVASEELAGTFDAGQVSAVGAGLNAAEGQSISLTIDKPAANEVIPEQYHNSLRFSMELRDSATGEPLSPEGQELAVPVKITLPVPASINPDFLVILHHHADGSNEEVIFPRISTENGVTYATFVVSRFSDFTMAELSARRTESGVEVATALPLGVDVESAWCAVYDGDGQLLAAQALNVKQPGELLSIPCDAARAETAKLFFFGGSFAPVGEVVCFTEIGDN